MTRPTKEFDAILKSGNTNVVKVGPLAPNLNAHAERFMLTFQSECVDHFVVLGEAHLRHLLAEFLEQYHQERRTEAEANVPLTGTTSPPANGALSPRQMACRKRLGGLLRHYHRRAA